MSDAQERERSRAAWELAGAQHGMIARRQLLDLGFTGGAIEHRLASGRLHPVMRGVYAVGWPEVTRDRRWMAAVLACGDGAALSHRSAAALWGIAAEAPGLVDVSVLRRCELRRPGLKVRGRPTMRSDEITVENRIPVTAVVRTLVDIATELDGIALERAVNEADKRDLIDPEMLRSALSRYKGKPGAPALRRLLDKRTFRLSDSDLEILFRGIAAAAGLPPPLTKQRLNGYEVDFFWPDLGLVVETDGLRYHRTPSTQSRDARRDRAHTLASLTPLRFTHYEVRHEARRVGTELARVAEALRQRIRD